MCHTSGGEKKKSKSKYETCGTKYISFRLVLSALFIYLFIYYHHLETQCKMVRGWKTCNITQYMLH